MSFSIAVLQLVFILQTVRWVSLMFVCLYTNSHRTFTFHHRGSKLLRLISPPGLGDSRLTGFSWFLSDWGLASWRLNYVIWLFLWRSLGSLGSELSSVSNLRTSAQVLLQQGRVNGYTYTHFTPSQWNQIQHGRCPYPDTL